MFDESISHFRGVRSILFFYLFIYLFIDGNILLGNNADPDQTPHMASDLGLYCLLMTRLRVSR